MDSKSHSGCPTCSQICEEAKNKVKTLEKKVYSLTIVTTVALTLLGEQAAKSVASYVQSFNSAMSSVDVGVGAPQEKENKEPEKVTQNGNLLPYASIPTNPNPIKNGSFNVVTDTLFNSEPSSPFLLEVEDKDDVTPSPAPKTVIKPIYTPKSPIETQIQMVNLPLDLTTLPVAPIADPYAVFFTPSYMPFDVYSTTLALGTNYGFGPYYGIDDGINYPPIPSSGPLSALAISQLLQNRKRTL